MSIAFAELSVVSKKVEKILAKKEVEKIDEDETEIQQELQMSGNSEGV